MRGRGGGHPEIEQEVCDPLNSAISLSLSCSLYFSVTTSESEGILL